MEIAHWGTTLVASFLASSVECVEALTIVLAVAITRGWRPALTGAGAALALLAGLVALLGHSLSLIPLRWLQIAGGRVMLDLFIADTRLTVGLLLWIAACTAASALLADASGAVACALFVGFAAILIENVVHVAASERRARR